MTCELYMYQILQMSCCDTNEEKRDYLKRFVEHSIKEALEKEASLKSENKSEVLQR